MVGVVVLCCAVLAAPAATAGAWYHAATYAAPAASRAACLRVAGPAQVALFGRAGATVSRTDVLHVAPGAIVPTAQSTLGWLMGCADAGGAALRPAELAGPVWTGAGVRPAVAPAGGPPVVLEGTDNAGEVAVAQAGSGAAVLAWFEHRPSGTTTQRRRVVAAVRPPGAAAFGAPVPVADWTTVTASDFDPPATGIDADGNVVVAWTDAHGLASTPWLATAAPGESFTAPQPLPGDGAPALAVADNGRALVATGSGPPLERLDAQTQFAAVSVDDLTASGPTAVALRPDGAAVLARDTGSGVAVWLRAPGGRFAAQQPPAPPPPDIGGGFLTVTGAGAAPRRPQTPTDWTAGRLHAAIGTDGAVLVTWTEEQAPGDISTVRAARGILTGGLERPATVSGRCRTAIDARIVTLDDGRLGVVWTDGPGGLRRRDLRRGPYRLHLSLADAAAADVPTSPRVRLRAAVAGPRAVRGGRPLRLRITCWHGPCDVRAAVGARDDRGAELEGAGTSSSTRTIADGATGRLDVVPFDGQGRPQLRPRRRTIDVIACAPSGETRQTIRLRPVLRQIQPSPLPRILASRARRRGDRVTITWRTDRPARRVRFLAQTRRTDPVMGMIGGRGRTRFRLALDGVPHATHTVTLVVLSTEADRARRVRVAIR
ncbi:MAG: hypothetical protein U0S48_06530 [Solirubrobacteraceae bacterium]